MIPHNFKYFPISTLWVTSYHEQPWKTNSRVLYSACSSSPVLAIHSAQEASLDLMPCALAPTANGVPLSFRAFHHIITAWWSGCLPSWTVSSLWARPTAYSGTVSQNPALRLTHTQQRIYYVFCSPPHANIHTAIACPPILHWALFSTLLCSSSRRLVE